MIYGETSEIPLSVKGYRLMVNYWHRVTNLPDQTLVKKALLENIYLRTNWIKTIEKLTNWYNIINLVDSPSRLRKASYNNSKSKFIEMWTNSLQNPEMPKLEFYRTQKNAFITEKYLDLPLFQHRQIITKLRCSDHQLDIERGRYRGILRTERICKLCTNNAIENEEHFLVRCPFYDRLKGKHNLTEFTESDEFMKGLDPKKLAKYLIRAFEIRKKQIELLE